MVLLCNNAVYKEIEGHYLLNGGETNLNDVVCVVRMYVSAGIFLFFSCVEPGYFPLSCVFLEKIS